MKMTLRELISEYMDGAGLIVTDEETMEENLKVLGWSLDNVIELPDND